MPDNESEPTAETEVSADAEGQPVQPKPNAKPKTAKAKRNFPQRTLEDALEIAAAIKEQNAGNPWDTDNVASAVSLSRTGSGFFYLAQASRAYGLTKGSRDSAEIALTDLGKQAVYPDSPTTRTQALQEAFLRVEPFKAVVGHYKGSKLPEEPYRTNMLTTTFKIDESFVPEFVEIFEANARFVGIGNAWESGQGPQDSSAATSTHVVGTPDSSESKGLRCFVAMPFHERTDDYPIGFFKEVLASLLTPAITEAGFEAFTADRQGSDVIHSTIVNDLLDADLVVVDLTEHNPNVLFELGMRMHADKPVALVRAKGTGQIFDVDATLRVLDYDPNLWKSTLEKDIPKVQAHVEAAWANRESADTYMGLLKRKE